MNQASYVSSVFQSPPLTRETYTLLWIELITTLERAKKVTSAPIHDQA